MLVAAFEVEVSRPGVIGPYSAVQNCKAGRPGVKPDIQDILFLGELARRDAFVRKANGEDIHRRHAVPGLDAIFLNDSHSGIVCNFIEDRLAIRVEDRDWDAPVALAGDGPVGATCDGGADAVAGLWRVPRDGVDTSEGLFAEVVMVNGDKPLHGGAEDQRLVRSARGVWVLVGKVAESEERSGIREGLRDDFIAFIR